MKQNAKQFISIKEAIMRLIKSGHVQRAYKPAHLTNSKNGQHEFIYRWSSRPYHDKIERIKNLPYDDMKSIDKAVIMRFLSSHCTNKTAKPIKSALL